MKPKTKKQIRDAEIIARRKRFFELAQTDPDFSEIVAAARLVLKDE